MNSPIIIKDLGFSMARGKIYYGNCEIIIMRPEDIEDHTVSAAASIAIGGHKNISHLRDLCDELLNLFEQIKTDNH